MKESITKPKKNQIKRVSDVVELRKKQINHKECTVMPQKNSLSKEKLDRAIGLIFAQKLSVYAKLVYLYICKCADKNGQASPVRQAIAKECGISLKSVDRATKELLHADLISKQAQYDEEGANIANLITVNTAKY